ncbi:MAG: hypothetical protein RR315_08820, partial [Oscillospiraceae bacterium]
ITATGTYKIQKAPPAPIATVEAPKAALPETASPPPKENEEEKEDEKEEEHIESNEETSNRQGQKIPPEKINLEPSQNESVQAITTKEETPPKKNPPLTAVHKVLLAGTPLAGTGWILHRRHRRG